MLKAGIIGYGYMGHFHYDKMLGFPEKVKPVAVYDIAEETRREAERKGMKIFDNIDDFLKEDMDLVVVATPNQWHAKYAVAAMNAGKNVMIEKPATMNVQEFEQIMECEKRTKKLFTVHQQRRHDVDYRIVVDMIQSGELGNVTTIESRVFGERGVCFGWRRDPEYGGGMLYDWGVHLIDQMLQLFKGQKVVRIQARLESVLTPAVDDYVEVVMEFDSGTYAKVYISTFVLEKLPRWFVFGDRGTLMLEDFSGTKGGARKIRQEVKGFDSVRGKKNLGPSRTMAPLAPECIEILELPQEEDESFVYWENLLDALENKKEPEVKSKEILRVMQIVDAAFEASKEKQVLEVNI